MSFTKEELAKYRKTKLQKERRRLLRQDPKTYEKMKAQARVWQRKRRRLYPEALRLASQKWYYSGGKKKVDASKARRLSDPLRLAAYRAQARVTAMRRYRRVRADKEEWKRYLSLKRARLERIKRENPKKWLEIKAKSWKNSYKYLK